MELQELKAMDYPQYRDYCIEILKNAIVDKYGGVLNMEYMPKLDESCGWRRVNYSSLGGFNFYYYYFRIIKED